jgi:2-oxoglutarate ferredoxin oxidoreductase subunit gamma
METSIIIAGFGGQGVLFTGQVLAHAGMDSGLNVTWIPSYGPEMRGGTANCTVLISDEAIGAPTVVNPDVAVVLNQPSFEKYEPLIRPGGILIVNSSLASGQSNRSDIEISSISASEIAEELGSIKMANMAALGALLARCPIVSLSAVSQSLADHLPSSKAHLLKSNQQVLKRGYEAAVTMPA